MNESPLARAATSEGLAIEPAIVAYRAWNRQRHLDRLVRHVGQDDAHPLAIAQCQRLHAQSVAKLDREDLPIAKLRDVGQDVIDGKDHPRPGMERRDAQRMIATLDQPPPAGRLEIGQRVDAAACRAR